MLKEPLRAQRKSVLYLHVLLKLNELLRSDGRFHDVAWHSYDDRRVGDEAFALPVEGDIPPFKPLKSSDSESGQKQGFFGKLLASRKAKTDRY